MKEKAIIFIVGLLLGSIISTASIYVYTTINNQTNNGQNMQMNNGGTGPIGNNTPPEMPNNNQIN